MHVHMLTRTTWTVYDARNRNITHEVDVVVDEEALRKLIQRLAWSAAQMLGGRAIHHHGLIVATVRRQTVRETA